jgi:zinc protease
VLPDVPAEPAQTAERRIDVAYDGQALPILWTAYKLGAFDPHDRVRAAADLLAELAFGETSAAYRRLVLDEQAVDLLTAEAGMNRDPSLFDVYARVKSPDNVRHVQDVIDATVAEYRAAPPDAQRLAALKSRLKYGFVMDMQTPDDAAQELAEHIGLTGDLDGVRALYAAYAAVTPADVQAAAQRYLVAERRTLGVLEGRR